MGLQLTPTSFVAGVETQIFAYDYDHDNDDLSDYTDPNLTTLCFQPVGSTIKVPWSVRKIGLVRGYNCDPDPELKDEGKVVGLLIYATPVAPPPGCLGIFFRFFGTLGRIFFNFRGAAGIGTGDLGGSTSAPAKPTVHFVSTTVTVY
jgi:hypothetical protein